MILTFNFRTIHAGVRVNFTGTNSSKPEGSPKSQSKYSIDTVLSIKKKLQYRRSKMQNDTLNRNYKVVPKL